MLFFNVNYQRSSSSSKLLYTNSSRQGTHSRFNFIYPRETIAGEKNEERKRDVQRICEAIRGVFGYPETDIGFCRLFPPPPNPRARMSGGSLANTIIPYVRLVLPQVLLSASAARRNSIVCDVRYRFSQRGMTRVLVDDAMELLPRCAGIKLTLCTTPKRYYSPYLIDITS